MSALLLDAGALVAIDKGDRKLRAMLQVAQQMDLPVRTGAPVVAQVWRGGRQANLARILAGVDVRPLDRNAGRRTGELLGATQTSDVVDAHLALLAMPGDQILTSGPDDIRRLIEERGVEVRIVRI